MGVIKEENYSIQAKNLLEFLIQDYSESLKSFHQDNYYLHEIKSFVSTLIIELENY